MELQNFLEKFLPDYEQKWEQFTGGKIPRGIIPLSDLHYKFQLKYFSEALQNFMNIYGEKQRENCAVVYRDEVNDSDFVDNNCSKIFNTPQPKIKEL